MDPDDKRELVWRIVRWTLAVPLMLSYPWLGLFSLLLAVLGVILIMPELVGFCSRLLTGQIYPSIEATPKPTYGIPESLAARGQYVEAEAEYEKIIAEFPDEVKPHIDLINIAVVRLNNGELAEKLYQRGLERLKNPADRETLTTAYEGIRTRLKTPEKLERKFVPWREYHPKNRGVWPPDTTTDRHGYRSLPPSLPH